MSSSALQIHENQENYLAAFASLGKQGPAWLAGLREAAIQRFSELGFPTTHDEEWKYTNIAPFVKARYAFNDAPAPALAGLDAYPVRVVLVNGRYSPELSATGLLPAGVTVRSLAEALAGEALVRQHFEAFQGYKENALVALNMALFQDGVFVHIPNGAVLEAPIYVLHVTTGDGSPAMSFARNLIVTGRDTQATIVEEHLGRNAGECFTNTVSQVIADEGSVIEHYKVQREGERTFHFGSLEVRQGRATNVTSHSIALGGALARNELTAVLAGEGAECTLNGLYLVTGKQHVDNYTTMDHAMPRSTSHEMYKGILDGAGQGVFHGRIIVRKDAQKTDAIQRNKNLLLSEQAVINTKPQLEIYADDVRCTHGATVGQVDPDAVFYLRSRGIGNEEARNLLTYAFASEMIDRIKVEQIRSQLAGALFERLSRREAL